MEKLSFYRKRIEAAIAQYQKIHNSEPLCLHVDRGFLNVYRMSDKEVIVSATTPDKLFSKLLYMNMMDAGQIELVEDEEEVEINLLDEALEGIEFEPLDED